MVLIKSQVLLKLKQMVGKRISLLVKTFNYLSTVFSIIKLIMKTKLLTTLIILLFCSTVFAQREQNKIGYIDIDYILNELPDFKEANNELNQKIETWKGEIELKQEKIRGLKEDLENERPLLTQDLIDEQIGRASCRERV